jgi:serine/threonine protein kinase
MDLQAALERALAGHYQVIREIGRGGMAVVYECRDLIAERSVAIKLLYPDLARALGGERFLREIRILQQLNHPNILPLLDSGSLELLPGVQLPWYAMPLAREETLRARLAREGALPLATALGYARDLCAALTHAHGQGVIHRDIKPENVLLVEGRAVLADFGIARAITVAGGDTLSTTGIVVGTPAYMSPEQSTGARQLDGRSDLYSLGVVLYEMLAGHAPFSGSTPQAVSARHQFEAPPPIVVVRPGLPAGVTELLEVILAKLPADRLQSAEQLAARLAALDLTAPSRKRQAGKWQKAVAAIGALFLIVGGSETYRRTSASTTLDQSRYVILPFETKDSAATHVVDGGDAGELVAEILSRIPDHRLVSTLTVNSMLDPRDSRLTLRKALRLAREVGAGRAIWGSIVSRADTIRVASALYDATTGREIASASVFLPITGTTIGLLSQQFADLTYQLVLPGEPAPETAASILAAKSMDSWRLYAAGDSAFNSWDFTTAENKYREALILDPDYPNANLKLAQLREWANAPEAEWREFARRAYYRRDHLSSPNRLLAKALFALAEQRYLEACRAYRGLLAADSLSFPGWFGLGQCHTRDDTLLPDSSSPSGWRFRTSYRPAIKAYRYGLTLVPSSYRAYGGAALNPLVDRMAATRTFLRYGRTSDSSHSLFAAYPSLSDDTLAFIPYPVKEVISSSTYPESWEAAIQANRQTLLSITTYWYRRFPEDLKARETQAEVQELVGNLSGTDESALEITRSLRGNPSFRSSPAVLSREARLLVKLSRFGEARSVAESALAISPRSREEGIVLAGMAALIGRGDRAADLLGRYGERLFATPQGEVVELDSSLALEANRMLVYSGMGDRPDSLIAIRDRLTRAAAGIGDPWRRRATIDAALFRPSMLAFPVITPKASGPYRLLRVFADISRGDSAGALQTLRSIVAGRSPQAQAALPPDFALLEARLFRLLGAHHEASSRLQLLLQSLANLGTDFGESTTEAAAIGRALSFQDSVGLSSRGSRAGALWVTSSP